MLRKIRKALKYVTKKQSAVQGFSLLQLSIALTAGSIAVVSALPGDEESSDMYKRKITSANLAIVESALRSYRATELHLPCPADPYASGASIGIENGSAGACSGGNVVSAGNNVYLGTIPYNSLNISERNTRDGWGNIFTYLVDQNFTDEDGCANNAGSDGAIVVQDPNTSDTTAMYAVVSHGKERHGAFMSAASEQFSSGATNSYVLENSDNDYTLATNSVPDLNFTGQVHYESDTTKCCVGSNCSEAETICLEFRLDGATASDRSAASISNGDINGDGYKDIIIGADQADYTGNKTGSTYVVFGKASGWSSTLSLSTLNGTTGFRLDGVSDRDYSGYSVGAGDINGDGYDDVIVGAYGADNNGGSSGSTYVVFGKASGWSSTLNLSTLNGTTGFRLDGGSAAESSGREVSAGDINGDGYEDVIVGAYQAGNNGTNSGSTYVVFGKASGWSSTLDLSTLNGTTGFRLDGGAAGEYSGGSVGAGDINGDGYEDVITGAWLAAYTAPSAGSAYVVFGKASGWSSTLNLSTLNGTTGVRLDGVTSSDQTGIAVGAGNINGDGYEDVIVGAHGADNNGASSGSTYVIFGKASGWSSTLNLSTLNGTTGFRLDGGSGGQYSGASVVSGDINADGYEDVITGAWLASYTEISAGSAYVVFGKASGWSSTLNLSTLNGTTGFRLDAPLTYEYAGQNVSAGDVNGDGYEEVIVGALNADYNGTNTGSTYIVSSAPSWASTQTLQSVCP